MNIKIESWSHCCGEWVHFGYFETKDDANKYIESKGYDGKYFRVGL